MWDLPKPKKRWYRRWWFTIPFFTLLLIGIAMGGVTGRFFAYERLVCYPYLVASFIPIIIFALLRKSGIGRSAGFLIAYIAGLAVGLPGGFFTFVEVRIYEAKAKQFDYSRLEAMESASLIFDRKGTVIGRMFTQNRDQVGFDDLPKNLIAAVIAREDSRFYEHKGVDYKGVARAVYENWRAGYTKQGASTLTQQLARNTFPEQLPPGDKTKERKILEMFVALEVEKHFNKDKILELYLNRVYFGNGFYGAEAAAKGYFGKRAKDMTICESAILAGLLRSPDKLSPWGSYQACIAERNVVLNNMLTQQKITREEYDAAFKEEPVLKNKRPLHQENYAADMVYQQVLRKFGKDTALGEGLRIYTTVDAALQRKAEETIRTQLATVERREGYDHQTYAKYDAIYKAANRQPLGPDGKRMQPEYLQGTAVMLDNHTGAILAIVGGRDFAHSELNRVTQVQVPPGTAFKPLVYAAAFEKGFFPGTAVQDAVMDNTKVMIGGMTGILGEWGPERADNHFEGTISARTALVKSKNGATARLGMMTGIQDVLDLVEDAGISSQLAAYPKTYLGGSEVSPMELTLAYTIFPNGGSRPAKPFIISRIEDKLGHVIFQEKPDIVAVIKPTTAYEVHDCLAQVLEQDGTAERAATELGLRKIPLGGKTGTAYNFTDLWFVGYSSEITCSVWMGFDQQRGRPKRSIYRGAFSKDLALPMWAELIKASFADYKPQDFTMPKGIIRVEICRHSGGLATDKCLENGVRTTYQEIATEEQAPKEPCPTHSGIIAEAVVAGGDPNAKRAIRREPLALTAIAMKEKAVLGADPYGSELAVEKMRQIAGVGNAQAPLISTDTVPLPEPPQLVNPNAPAPKPILVPPSPNSDTKLDPPEPLKFN